MDVVRQAADLPGDLTQMGAQCFRGLVACCASAAISIPKTASFWLKTSCSSRARRLLLSS